jgi:hypothetical protein
MQCDIVRWKSIDVLAEHVASILSASKSKQESGEEQVACKFQRVGSLSGLLWSSVLKTKAPRSF